MSKIIKCSRDREIIIDNNMFEFLTNYTWTTYSSKSNFYAKTSINVNGRAFQIDMHRLLLNPLRNLVVDHINGNGLDNRFSNLRICTNQENSFNKFGSNNKTSIYKGVRKGHGNKYYACITKNYKTLHLGTFETERDAANAYNNKAIELFGEFANINKILD